MKIGIDIDDTIADTSLLVIEYIKTHLNMTENINSLIRRMKDFVQGLKDDEEARKFAINYLQEIILRVKSKENASKVIKKLKAAGNDIVIITARGDKHFKDSYDITYKWLIDNNIYFDKLICDSGEKITECLEENINIMIDDSTNVCSSLKEQGIDTILFNSKSNIEEKFDGIRVNNWNEIEKLLLK